MKNFTSYKTIALLSIAGCIMAPHFAHADTIGDTAILGGTFNEASNCRQVIPSVAGTITSISWYGHAAASGNYSVAVYSDTGNVPNVPLATSGIDTAISTTDAWNTQSISYTFSPNQVLWLCAWSNTTFIQWYYGSSGALWSTSVMTGQTYRTWPTWTQNQNFDLHTSVYATYTPAPADVTSNLAGHWAFDEGTGSTAADSSGNGNTLTLTNGVTWSGGKIGSNAEILNGTSQYAQLPASAFGSYPTGGSTPTYDLTFSAWFKTTGSATGDVILGLDDNTIVPSIPSGYVPAIYVGVDGKVHASMFWHNSVSNQIVSASAYNDGTWHLLTDTYTAGVERLYIDGSFVGSQTQDEVGFSSTYAYFLGVGYATTAWSDFGPIGGSWVYFTGALDDVRIYNRALSPTDIKGLAGLDAGLFGWWKFDEGSGTTAADSSGNGNTGTLGGTTPPSWTTGKVGPYAINNTVGIGGSGGYVSTPNITSATHQDISWSAWVYPTDLTGQSGFNIFLSGNNYGFEAVNSSGNFLYRDRQNNDHIYTGSTIPLNNWVMLTATCHDTLGVADVLTMYINGVQVKQDAGALGDLYCYDNFTDQFYVAGNAQAPGSYGWTGYVDDARIYYGRLLSNSDVSALYALGAPPPAPPSASFHSFLIKLGRKFTIQLGKTFKTQ